MQSPNLEKIQKTLETIAETDLAKPQEVKDNVMILENLLLSEKFTLSEEEALVHYLRQTGLLRKIQLLYETFENYLEVTFAKEILRDNRVDYREYLLYERFRGLITTEIKLAQIEKQDRLLFIGSGAFPISAILFGKLTDCSVDCYEKNADHARLSSEVVSYLGLSDRIRIENRKAEYLINNNYSIVVIAVLAKPKNEIFKRVIEEISTCAKLICRTSDHLRQAFYEATEPECLGLCRVVKINHAKRNQTISSVLLEPINT